MGEKIRFEGFYLETVDFFRNLTVNNNKKWFEENRSKYEKYVLIPAQAFVVELGSKLESIAPGIVAIPKIDKSIFRLHRDIRFSKDKIPYKTHLGIFMWEGEGKKLENPGFYFQLDARGILMGVGIHIFSKPLLKAYRESVIAAKSGEELVKAAEKVKKYSGNSIEGKNYKTVPRGFDAGHPLAEWLLYNGLAAMYRSEHPGELFTDAFLDVAFRKFQEMSPIHFWIRNTLYRSSR